MEHSLRRNCSDSRAVVNSSYHELLGGAQGGGVPSAHCTVHVRCLTALALMVELVPGGVENTCLERVPSLNGYRAPSRRPTRTRRTRRTQLTNVAVIFGCSLSRDRLLTSGFANTPSGHVLLIHFKSRVSGLVAVRCSP
jgi:hypothetical protein